MVYPERDALLSCGARGPYRIARDVQHPGRIGGFRKDADSRRIAGERAIGERVDLGDA